MKASEYFENKSNEIAKSAAIVNLEALLSRSSMRIQRDNSPAMVDPGTIIAAAEAVVEVYNFLFGGNNDDQITKMLDYLKSELDQVINLLNQVVDLLKQLPVLFFEQLKELAILHLKGSIYTITDNYSSWKQNIAANAAEITNLLDDLKGNSIVAMGYGYTHYDSIALALTQEYTLSKLVGKTTDTINSSLARYKSYFSMAVTYSVQGSLADAKNNIATQIQTLTSQFPVNEIDCGTQAYKYGRCYYDYHVYLTVAGDIANGFTFSQRNGPGVNNGNCDPREGGRPGGGAATPQVSKPAINFTWVEPQTYINLYNNAHVQYLNLVSDADSLQQAINNCNKYIDLTNQLMAAN